MSSNKKIKLPSTLARSLTHSLIHSLTHSLLTHSLICSLSLFPPLSSSKYPPITSEATRAEYKRIFNVEYQEYLGLKSQVEVVTNEVTALSEQMAAVKRGTEEAKVLSVGTYM